MKEALQELVRRHAALRTVVFRNPAYSDEEWERDLRRFARTGILRSGRYLQRVLPDAEIEFSQHDLRALDPETQQAKVEEIFRAETTTPFNEEKHFGLRVTLIHLSETEHRQLMTMDHILSDGWSAALLERETEQMYHHFNSGALAPPIPRITYQEFTEWQHNALKSGYLDQELAYWREQWRRFGSARIAIAEFPFARPASQRPNHNIFLSEILRLDSPATSSLRGLARRSRTTLFTVVLAGFLTVLSLYTRRRRIAVWCHCANRVRPDIEDVVGYFINTHLMGFDLPEDITFTRLLTGVANRIFETLKHQQLPLPYLWQVLGCSPRFGDSGALIDYLPAPPSASVSSSGCTSFTRVNIDGQTPGRMASIGVYVMDHGKELSLRSDYRSSLYSSRGVRTMLKDIMEVLVVFADNPETRISAFPQLANRYVPQQFLPADEMGDFILVGSDRLPSAPSDLTSSGDSGPSMSPLPENGNKDGTCGG